MKVVCIIPVKGREQVLKVTRRHILQNAYYASRYGISLNVQFFDTDHFIPLGKKLNNALGEVKNMRYHWDYLMVLGSDNLLRPQYWAYVMAAMEEDLLAFGFSECLLYDRINHQAKLWQHAPSTFGAGRMVSRGICEVCEWKLWDDAKENGIDNSQERRIYEVTKQPIYPIPTHKPVICDIKDGDNLNSYDSIEGMTIDPLRAMLEFPDLTHFYAFDTKKAEA